MVKCTNICYPFAPVATQRNPGVLLMATEEQDPLLPVRHPVPDLFSIDVASISLKDTQQHLEHPFFVLSTKPDINIRHYNDHNGNSITITPSALGMPTIRDKDILVYAISHIMHTKNLGEPISRRVVIYSADALRFANRHLSGRDYKSLEQAILRLRGCTIQTNIRAGDNLFTNFFGLLDSASLERKYDTYGRLLHCEITLSEWLWQAIQADQVLTLHPDYFRLRRPLERRLYEIARKHCGRQPSWTIHLSLLQKKCAYQSTLPDFRRVIRKIVKQAAKHDNYLPGYLIEYLEGQDRVRFRPRPGEAIPLPNHDSTFSDNTWHAAQAAAPDHDPRELCRLWQIWCKNKKLAPPHDPDAAFLGFVTAFVHRTQQATIAGTVPPAPDDETIDPKAHAWWTRLPDDVRQSYEKRHRVYVLQEENFFRSDKQLIEYNYRCHGPRKPS